jgi:hypothetical protein
VRAVQQLGQGSLAHLGQRGRGRGVGGGGGGQRRRVKARRTNPCRRPGGAGRAGVRRGVGRLGPLCRSFAAAAPQPPPCQGRQPPGTRCAAGLPGRAGLQGGAAPPTTPDCATSPSALWSRSSSSRSLAPMSCFLPCGVWGGRGRGGGLRGSLAAAHGAASSLGGAPRSVIQAAGAGAAWRRWRRHASGVAIEQGRSSPGH